MERAQRATAEPFIAPTMEVAVGDKNPTTRRSATFYRGGPRPGPTDNCSDCDERMVWQRTWSDDDRNSPGSWMCPNCVLKRCEAAEDAIRTILMKYPRKMRLRALLARWW